MEVNTDVSQPGDASRSPSDAVGRDAALREDRPFPLSDDELLELAVLCLIVRFQSSSRAPERGMDWWGGV